MILKNNFCIFINRQLFNNPITHTFTEQKEKMKSSTGEGINININAPDSLAYNKKNLDADKKRVDLSTFAESIPTNKAKSARQVKIVEPREVSPEPINSYFNQMTQPVQQMGYYPVNPYQIPLQMLPQVPVPVAPLSTGRRQSYIPNPTQIQQVPLYPVDYARTSYGSQIPNISYQMSVPLSGTYGNRLSVERVPVDQFYPEKILPSPTVPSFPTVSKSLQDLKVEGLSRSKVMSSRPTITKSEAKVQNTPGIIDTTESTKSKIVTRPLQTGDLTVSVPDENTFMRQTVMKVPDKNSIDDIVKQIQMNPSKTKDILGDAKLYYNNSTGNKIKMFPTSQPGQIPKATDSSFFDNLAAKFRNIKAGIYDATVGFYNKLTRGNQCLIVDPKGVMQDIIKKNSTISNQLKKPKVEPLLFRIMYDVSPFAEPEVLTKVVGNSTFTAIGKFNKKNCCVCQDPDKGVSSNANIPLPENQQCKNFYCYACDINELEMNNDSTKDEAYFIKGIQASLFGDFAISYYRRTQPQITEDDLQVLGFGFAFLVYNLPYMFDFKYDQVTMILDLLWNTYSRNSLKPNYSLSNTVLNLIPVVNMMRQGIAINSSKQYNSWEFKI